MTTRTVADKIIQINDQGFMIDPAEWTKEIAIELAREEGIPELTEAHWQIIDYCRRTASETGSAPTMRQITTGTGITTKELFNLYPKGPAKKVARISGLAKPEGCV